MHEIRKLRKALVCYLSLWLIGCSSVSVIDRDNISPRNPAQFEELSRKTTGHDIKIVLENNEIITGNSPVIRRDTTIWLQITTKSGDKVDIYPDNIQSLMYKSKKQGAIDGLIWGGLTGAIILAFMFKTGERDIDGQSSQDWVLGAMSGAVMGGVIGMISGLIDGHEYEYRFVSKDNPESDK